MGTLAGGFLLERFENVQFAAMGLDRYKAMILLSVALRLLVALVLVRPLDNDRDGTPAQLVSSLFHGHQKILNRR